MRSRLVVYRYKIILGFKNIFAYKCYFIDLLKGPWSKCIGDCWNASRSRTVVCIKNDGFAEESECDLDNKPITFEDCGIKDLKDCTAKWHYSEWSEVTENNK